MTANRRDRSGPRNIGLRRVIHDESDHRLRLKSRVVATVSVFDNKEDNVLRTQIDTDGSVTGVKDRTYSAPVGARTTKGFEGDINFRFEPDQPFECDLITEPIIAAQLQNLGADEALD